MMSKTRSRKAYLGLERMGDVRTRERGPVERVLIVKMPVKSSEVQAKYEAYVNTLLVIVMVLS